MIKILVLIHLMALQLEGDLQGRLPCTCPPVFLAAPLGGLDKEPKVISENVCPIKTQVNAPVRSLRSGDFSRFLNDFSSISITCVAYIGGNTVVGVGADGLVRFRKRSIVRLC